MAANRARPTTAVQVENISKKFASRVAVRDVSFTLDGGEILGLVGPNGAGKTTTIRMVLDLIKPDSGRVLLFGAPFSHAHRSMLGYLPEERGLYRGLRVRETLEYLGALKGLERTTARNRAHAVLDRLGMDSYGDARVAELSRGLAQLIQFAATVVHQPRFLVMDEPFSGLDPVNTRLLEGVLQEMRRDGTAIVLSTHQMNQVEELCDRVLMVDMGSVVLYGTLGEVRAAHSRGSVILECPGNPGTVRGVQRVSDLGTHYELVLAPGASPQAVLEDLVLRGVEVRRFQVAALPLEEIFVRLARARR